jgi:hypothetical protein
MKPKTIMLLFSFSILLGICGCKDEIIVEDIPVVYARYPCQTDSQFIRSFSTENILLFDSKKTTSSEMVQLSNKIGKFLFISYNSESFLAAEHIIDENTNHVTSFWGYISNFPEELFKREIPSNGVLVSYTGDAFELCVPQPSVDFQSINIVLKTFKIYSK